jgi:hypothetical protein
VTTLVIWLNIILAMGAIVTSCVAAHRGVVTHRAHFAGVVALAGLYVVGYLWLLFNPDRVRAWSEFFRGVSLASWCVVWIAPAWRSIAAQRDLTAKIDDLEAKVKERLQ